MSEHNITKKEYTLQLAAIVMVTRKKLKSMKS